MAGAVALAVAAVAAASPGDILWQGVTSEGVVVKLTVGTAGDAHSFKIGKTESRCESGGTVTSPTVTHRDLDTSNPQHFRDKDRIMSDHGRFHYHTTSRLHGRLDDEPHSWSGGYKLHIKVFKRGETVDTCVLDTRWSVGRRVGDAGG